MNDRLEDALVIPNKLPFTNIFSNVGATPDTSEDVCGLGGLVYGVWFQYTATEALQLILEVSEPEFSCEFAVMAASAGSTPRSCIDKVQNGVFFRSDVYEIAWEAKAGVTYEFLVAGREPEFGMNTFRLSLKGIPIVPSPTPTGTDPSAPSSPTTPSTPTTLGSSDGARCEVPLITSFHVVLATACFLLASFWH